MNNTEKYMHSRFSLFLMISIFIIFRKATKSDDFTILHAIANEWAFSAVIDKPTKGFLLLTLITNICNNKSVPLCSYASKWPWYDVTNIFPLLF